jgi:TM2 domain-containing membrane protein YozV
MADKETKIFDKLPYGICGILLGGIGVNSFIAGNVGMGILKILLCWTGIPAIVGLIQGILALCRPEARLRQTGIFKFEGVEGGSAISEYKV